MAIYTGKDANRPKRPQSAYFLWLADFRATMKDKFVENKDILRAGKNIYFRILSRTRSWNCYVVVNVDDTSHFNYQHLQKIGANVCMCIISTISERGMQPLY